MGKQIAASKIVRDVVGPGFTIINDQLADGARSFEVWKATEQTMDAAKLQLETAGYTVKKVVRAETRHGQIVRVIRLHVDMTPACQ